MLQHLRQMLLVSRILFTGLRIAKSNLFPWSFFVSLFEEKSQRFSRDILKLNKIVLCLRILNQNFLPGLKK